MNPENWFDEFLTTQLRGQQNYIPDDGFSARVLANVPKNPTLSLRLQALILWFPTTLIAGLLLSQFPWRDWMRVGYGTLLTLNSTTLVQASCVFAVSVSLAIAIWVGKQWDIV